MPCTPCAIAAESHTPPRPPSTPPPTTTLSARPHASQRRRATPPVPRVTSGLPPSVSTGTGRGFWGEGVGRPKMQRLRGIYHNDSLPLTAPCYLLPSITVPLVPALPHHARRPQPRVPRPCDPHPTPGSPPSSPTLCATRCAARPCRSRPSSPRPPRALTRARRPRLTPSVPFTVTGSSPLCPPLATRTTSSSSQRLLWPNPTNSDGLPTGSAGPASFNPAGATATPVRRPRYPRRRMVSARLISHPRLVRSTGENRPLMGRHPPAAPAPGSRSNSDPHEPQHEPTRNSSPATPACAHGHDREPPSSFGPTDDPFAFHCVRPPPECRPTAAALQSWVDDLLTWLQTITMGPSSKPAAMNTTEAGTISMSPDPRPSHRKRPRSRPGCPGERCPAQSPAQIQADGAQTAPSWRGTVPPPYSAFNPPRRCSGLAPPRDRGRAAGLWSGAPPHRSHPPCASAWTTSSPQPRQSPTWAGRETVNPRRPLLCRPSLLSLVPGPLDVSRWPPTPPPPLPGSRPVVTQRRRAAPLPPSAIGASSHGAPRLEILSHLHSYGLQPRRCLSLKGGKRPTPVPLSRQRAGAFPAAIPETIGRKISPNGRG